MGINGFKLKYSKEELAEKMSKETRQIELIDKENPAYNLWPKVIKKHWII